MIKKILFLTILFFSTIGFSQQKSIDNLLATPNPFTESTVISFDSTKEQAIYLVVKNVLGKTVFARGYYSDKGTRKIVFERKDLKPGMYIYSIQNEKDVISKRFIIK